MITFEALDVILRVQNLPSFMAKMRAGAKSVSSIGTAAVDTNKKATTAIYAAARKATLGLTAMAAVAGATGYKMSVEFEKQLTLLHTQAGASVAEMNAFKKPLLELARQSAQGPIELAKGLYHIKSIGIPAAQAMEALKVASQGAAVGNANLEQTTSALGAAWLSGINGAGTFQHTMSVLNATVGAGNMRMDELVTALGTGVLPTAKLAGLSIQDVMAALALLKDEGYGAYGAMAQFATALHFFTDPTKKAQEAFKKLGLSSLDLADTMRKKGMVAALTELQTRLHLTGQEVARLSSKNWSPLTQQEKLLGDILPGGRGRVFRVLLNQIPRYQMKLNQINKTSGNFQKAVVDTQMTAANRLHTAWSNIQVDLITFGDTIKDSGTNGIITLIKVLGVFIGVLTNVSKHIGIIISVLAPLIAAWLAYKTAVIGAAIATEFWMGLQTVAAFIALIPLITSARDAWVLFDIAVNGNAIALAVIAIIAVLYLLVTHWKQVKAVAADVWQWIVDHWKILAIVLGGPFGALAVLIISNWHKIRDAGVAAWDAIKGAFAATLKFFQDKWHWLTSSGFVKFFTKSSTSAQSPTGRVNALRGPAGLGPRRGGYTGGYVTSGGMMDVGEHGRETVILPTGARIAPAGFHSQPGGASSAMSDGWFELHVHSYLDGKEVTENVSRHMANKKARQ